MKLHTLSNPLKYGYSLLLGLGLLLGGWIGVAPAAPAPSVVSNAPRFQTEAFGKLADGTEIQVHTLRNRSGMKVRAIDYGANLIEVSVPDRNGNSTNVVLGASTLDAYLGGFPASAAVIGRYANRIRNARFTLDGKEIRITANMGEHHIHGGRKNFSSAAWRGKTASSTGRSSVAFQYRSPDGEEGFPGNLDVTVTYTLTDAGDLIVEYGASTDAPTVVNLTNHAYFNLAGGGDVLGHELQLQATRYTVPDKLLIPTGEIAPVAGTPLDFSQPTRIGARIEQLYAAARGYDHNYIVEGTAGTLRRAALAQDPASGRTLECWTTEPGVQLYTANHFNGNPFPKHGAFCLETQHAPDSPNRPEFPSTVVRPGQPFKSRTEFRFR